MLFIGLSIASITCAQAQPLTPVVEAEEVGYTFTDPDNGSGPMWCFGNSCLVCGDGEQSGEIPGFGRFQPTPDRSLFVIYFLSGTGTGGYWIDEMRLMELYADGASSGQIRQATEHLLNSIFIAGPRAGCKPSSTIKLLGTPRSGANELRYLRVRLY